MATTGAAAVPDDGADWILFKVTAPPEHGVVVNASLTFSVRARGSDAVLWGTAFSSGTVMVQPLASGHVEVATSRDAGGQRLRVAPGTGNLTPFTGSMSFVGRQLAAGESAAIVGFFPGAVITLERRPQRGDGHTVEVVTGSGSTALEATDPANDGLAASVGLAHAGGITHRAELADGIVGAYVANSCLACSIGWTGPDGTRHDAVLTPPFDWAEEEAAFVGPPGAWTWDWTGLAVPRTFVVVPASAPQVLAWAPIGSHWELFQPAPRAADTPSGALERT